MKFNIRDILWFTVVVALSVTCCLERDKRRGVTRNWVAAVNEVSKVRESLEREIGVAKQKLNMAQRDHAQLNRNYANLSGQLSKEVTERIRLTRELERLASLRVKPKNEPSLDLTGNQ